MNPEGRRHSSTTCIDPLVLGNDLPPSLMSALNEAPEDIVNAQDHCLRPEGLIFPVTYLLALNPLLSDNRSESTGAPYRISRARGMAKYMPITASAPTMLIEAAAHWAPTSDENAPMNIPPTNSTTWVI